MNKQIQKLIKQCTTYYNGGLGTEIEVFDKEKFAELIVRECAEQVDWILAEGGKTQGDLIKQHFGVAE
jgi:hypothetical protein